MCKFAFINESNIADGTLSWPTFKVFHIYMCWIGIFFRLPRIHFVKTCTKYSVLCKVVSQHSLLTMQFVIDFFQSFFT